MEKLLKLAILGCLAWVSSGCKTPSAAVGFSNARYFGLWYEVGKFETSGWSFFYKDCACTQTEVKSIHGNSSGEATASHSCRLGSHRGPLVSKTGVLKREGPLGKWRESFGALSRSIDYTVVYLDDNFALEYDCDDGFVRENYCLHVMSRTPTIDEESLELLVKVVDELGLNTSNRKFVKTKQSGCPL